MNEELRDAMRNQMAHIFALQAMTNAIIATHPDKKSLGAAYEQFAAAVPSMLLVTSWEEEQISYAEEQLEHFRKRLR